MGSHVLFLPGIDPKTEQWAKNLVHELGMSDDSVVIQRYLHWDDTEIPVQREVEIERLEGYDVNLLIGKSLGVGLGLRASLQGFIHPKQAIFIGSPLTSLIKQGHDLRLMVKEAGIPSMFIQQKEDPLGGAALLQETLPDSQIIEVPGDDHQYGDIKLLKTYILEWLEKASR